MFQFPSVDMRCFCCRPTLSPQFPFMPVLAHNEPYEEAIPSSECAVNTVGPLPQLVPSPGVASHPPSPSPPGKLLAGSIPQSPPRLALAKSFRLPLHLSLFISALQANL